MPIQLSGSLVITGSITTTGVITMSGSIASASYSSTSDLLQGTGSVGFTTTASFNAVSASQQQISASYIALSASYNTFSGSASTRITVDSASLLQVSSSQQQISASLLNVIAIGATTGSNSFRANQSITGSLVVSSTITAQTLVVQTVTSSIVYSSGSNIFGCDFNSRQTFTGSMLITGSNIIANVSTACFSGQLCAPTVVASTCLAVKAGNATSVVNNIAGAVSNNHFAMQRNDAQYASIGLNGSDNFTVFGTSTSCPRLTIDSSGISCFANSVQSTDFRYTNTGYLTYDTANTGTECLVIRKNGTSVLTFNSNSSATFANTVCANAGLITNTLSITCNSGDDRAMYMSLNCSANYNSGADNTIARSVNSLKFLWYNNCWEIGATRGGDTAIQALVFAKNGNTYLAMNCNGIANFACQVCSPSFNSTSTSYLNGLVVSCNVNSNCFTGITVYNGAGGGSEASRAGIAFQAYDWVQSAIWHGRNTAAAFAGALLFGTNPSTSNLGVGGVCTRLTIDNNGVSTFACTVCAPLFKGGSFLTSTCSFSATSAGTNYDITGPGAGRWLASVSTNAVYHWNGILALNFFDSADFSVNILTCGSYTTAASISIVNSGSSLRFCFNRDVGTVSISYLNF